MKIQRFNCISSLPAVMHFEEFSIPDKVYDKSIVDPSCYSPLEDELAKVQPMTQSEIQQHYDFVNGKDDGRELPPPRDVDLAEVSQKLHNAEKKLQSDIEEATLKKQKEIEQQQLIESITGKKE